MLFFLVHRTIGHKEDEPTRKYAAFGFRPTWWYRVLTALPGVRSAPGGVGIFAQPVLIFIRVLGGTW